MSDTFINEEYVKKLEESRDALLEACKKTLEALEVCGYGGKNISLERRHEKILKSAIALAEKGE